MFQGTLKKFLIAGLIAFLPISDVTSAGDASTLKVGGSGSDLATMKLLAAEFSRTHPELRVTIVEPSLGSSGGIKAVAAGVLNIGMSSRPLKESERRAGLHETTYAKSPLVFATLRFHGQTNLSYPEITDIYRGRRTEWPDGSRLRLVLRPDSDSDTIVLRDSIPGMKPALDEAYRHPGFPIAATDQDSADQIAAIPGGVGTSVLSLLLAEKRPLKVFTLNGVAPSPETIANGKYPLVKTLYLVTPASPNAATKKFLVYLRSDEAVKLLRRTGHFPLPVTRP
jgi:phosphate transport system substrate-binding protein